jgi:acetyl esterase/lipase
MQNYMDWLLSPHARAMDKPDKELMEWIYNAKPLRDAEWAEMVKGMKRIPLWEEGAPDYALQHGPPPLFFMCDAEDVPNRTQAEYDKQQPSVLICPKKREGRPRGMVIISAGGGFVYKSCWEAAPVARRFYEYGFATCILDYRVQPFSLQDGLMDIQRAIRLLRHNAQVFNILPDKICCLGFSAGGILSSLAGVKFDYGYPDAEDPIERFSCRPDAVIQCYGAFSVAGQKGHGLGFSFYKQNSRVEISAEKNIRRDCPPFFLWETIADDPRNILRFAGELTDFGVPFELHIFPESEHGCGLADGSDEHAPYARSTARWSRMAAEFLENLQF